VLDVVSVRVPHGFERLEDVVNPAELTAIRGQYAAIAGFALSQAERHSPTPLAPNGFVVLGTGLKSTVTRGSVSARRRVAENSW